MALHQFANDFFGMLGGGLSQEELDQLVADEWKQRWGQTLPSDVRVYNYIVIIILLAETLHRHRRFQKAWRKIGAQSRIASVALQALSIFRIAWTTKWQVVVYTSPFAHSDWS